MDPLLQFLTWQFLLFSLGIAGITFVVRLIFEYYKTDIKHAQFWNNLILPILPLFAGCIMGWLMKMYPYPEGLTSVSSHVLFGLVAGMFSGLIYRVLKSVLSAKLSPADSDTSTITVPVTVTVPVAATPPVVQVPEVVVAPSTQDLSPINTSENIDPQVVDSIRKSIQK